MLECFRSQIIIYDILIYDISFQCKGLVGNNWGVEPFNVCVLSEIGQVTQRLIGYYCLNHATLSVY